MFRLDLYYQFFHFVSFQKTYFQTMPSKKFTNNNKNLSDEILSPETLEIITDDEFDSDLFDEDSNSQSKYKQN